MFTQFLFRKIDNAQLVVFRIFYGLLVAAECYGAIATGWVRRTMVEPKFTFSFIGFEWLQPLPGNGMYIYFAVMGTLGLLIALGYKYRFSALGFAIMWTGVYLMQKTSYNNHYYLLMLLAYIMAIFPANPLFQNNFCVGFGIVVTTTSIIRYRPPPIVTNDAIQTLIMDFKV